MFLNSLCACYNLAEFHHYVNQIDDNCVCLLELLIDTSIDKFEESDFRSPFVVETDKQSYVFSDYTVNEYYDDEDGMVRVICMK